jgi:hypothetical protein
LPSSRHGTPVISIRTPSRDASRRCRRRPQSGGQPQEVLKHLSVGISREALNVHLKRFEREGIITVNYAAVEVHKFAELENLIKQGGGTVNLLRRAGPDHLGRGEGTVTLANNSPFFGGFSMGALSDNPTVVAGLDRFVDGPRKAGIPET